MAQNIRIVGQQKTSLIDYPKTVATVLFLSGCNLRCPYCHNAGVVNGEYESISFDEIRSHLVKRRGIVEGAVISGGEPTIHEGVKDLCDELRALGLKIKIDTNGLEPDAIVNCAPDYLALDIKTSLDNYNRLNISSNYHDYIDRLRRSINIVRDMADSAEIRITAAPGVVDTDDIAKLIPELNGVGRVYIQQFEPAKEMIERAYKSTKPYEAHVIDNWRKMLMDAGVGCRVRGDQDYDHT